MKKIFLFFPLAEIFLIALVISKFSFFDFILFSLSTGLLGAYIMSMFGKALLMEAQTNISQGKIPSLDVLHRILIFFGGFFLFLPGVMTDAIGLLLVLPGLRHIFVFWFRILLVKSVANGGLQFFKMSQNGFGKVFTAGFQGSFRTDQGQDYSQKMRQEEPHEERDARVIDVDVIESSRKRED